MRLAGIAAAALLIGFAVFQSLTGGTPLGRADGRIMLAESDICLVEAATVPAVASEERTFVTTPAYKELVVTPAQFGTRMDTVTVVPEHREGATFATEERRVIISEPTRRLRVIDPVFAPAPVVEARTISRPRVENGVLITDIEELPPLPETRIVTTEARIQAVRINAGLRMLEVQVVEEEGEGDLVPAETVEIKVRAVEIDPKVETVEVAAITETATVDYIDAKSVRVEAEALCALSDRTALIRQVQDVLVARGFDAGTPGEWTPETIDAVAAAQAEDIGLVSSGLLLQTLQEWLPEIALPTT